MKPEQLIGKVFIFVVTGTIYEITYVDYKNELLYFNMYNDVTDYHVGASFFGKAL